MEPAQEPRYTEDEYLEQERHSETKSEFLRGQIMAMSGGSGKHNIISSNIIRALGNLLRGRSCLVFTSDERILIPSTGLYTYPDVSVVCGRAEFSTKDRGTLTNPVLVVEVLSDSTEAYDRGAKFAHYRNIPSLVEYLLVSSTERRVEHYHRIEPGQWLLTVREGDQAVSLPALGVELAFAEIYEDVEMIEGEG